MELDPKLIAAIVAFLGALTMLVKVYTDILRIKADRSSTKEARDKDSQELHDQVLKNTLAITTLKDNQALHATVMDDLRDAVSVLNTNVAKLGVVVDNLSEAVRELKHD